MMEDRKTTPHPVQGARYVWRRVSPDGDPLNNFWRMSWWAKIDGKMVHSCVEDTDAVMPFPDKILSEVISAQLYQAMAVAYELGVKTGKGE